MLRETADAGPIRIRPREGGRSALLGAVESGEEALDVNRRLIRDERMHGDRLLGHRGRQRIPACAQYLQAVLGWCVLSRVGQVTYNVERLIAQMRCNTAGLGSLTSSAS